MIDQKIRDAINEQIGYEFYSGYLYLAMSAHYEVLNLKGFATWMRTRFGEEQVHALKLFEYVNARGGEVVLPRIEQPQSSWKTNLAVFEDALAHEQSVTARINKLYELAVAEKDYATQAMLQWFITEQVEEEKSVTEIIEQLKLIDARGTAVLMLDHQLNKADRK